MLTWRTNNWPHGVQREITGYNKPLYSILNEAARQWPDKVYTIFNDGVRTFAQVKDAADRIASFLSSNGLEPGDRVAVFLPNIPHYPSIFFGILMAGGICVTCNPMYTAPELNAQLRDSGAKAVFCMDHPKLYPTAVKAVEGTSVETVVICGVKSHLPKIKGFLGGLLGKIPKAEYHQTGHFYYDQILASYKPDPIPVNINPDTDPALIIYTGGTTGVPKGACLTHANFVFDIMALDEWVRLPHEKGLEPEKTRRGGFHTYLGVLPWYHSFGLTLCLLGACASGSRLVCVPDPRAGNPPFTQVLKDIQKYKVTVIVAVPTIYIALINHPLLGKYDLTSVMVCSSGGAPLPVEVAKQFEAKTGSIIYEGYGLSETSPVVTVNPTNLKQRKFGSVGFPISNTDVKIVDTDTGLIEMEGNLDGEIALSGPQVMLGYWDKPQENEAVFRELDGKRYFLTGDIGHIDEEGYVVITDRKKDMILVGGFNCYPREVEEVLFTHPKIANAAVVGIPDPVSGEAVKAFIMLKPGVEATEKEIMDYCHEHLAGYKRPRIIEFRDQLPVSVVGKVLRRFLRDEEMARKTKKTA